jgi:ABC-type Na+ transport system ATPase subunit NatA
MIFKEGGSMNFTTFTLKLFKRIFNPRMLVILGLILLLIFWVVNKSADEYEKNLEKWKYFKQFEKHVYKSYKSYNHVRDYGLRIFFLPSRLLFLNLDSNLLPGMSGRINAGLFLEIHRNLISPSPFKKKYPTFSNLILWLITLLAIFFGIDAIFDREYLKTLCGSYKGVKLYFSIILARLVAILISIFLIYLTAYFVILSRFGTMISQELDVLFYHSLFSLILITVFFFTGIIIGFVRRIWPMIALSIIGWSLLVFVIPFMQSLFAKDPVIVSKYQVEYNTAELLMNFENNAYKNFGKPDRDKFEIQRQAVEGYWNNERLDVQKMEKDLENQLFDLSSEHNAISIFSPVSYFTYLSNEASSGGSSAFFGFYQYVQDLKAKLLRFFIDQYYYLGKPVENPKVVPFIKGEENLFRAESRVPGNYLAGVLVNTGYVLILFFASLFLFLRETRVITKEQIAQLGDVDIDMKSGTLSTWLIVNNSLKNLFYQLFTGNIKMLREKGFRGKVTVDGKDVSSEQYIGDISYICKPKAVPGSLRVCEHVKSFADFKGIPPHLEDIWKKKVGKLSEKENFEIAYAILGNKKKDVYIIDDLVTGLPLEYHIRLRNKMVELAKSGALVIFLKKPDVMDMDIAKIGLNYNDGSTWVLWVALKMRENEVKEGMDRENSEI